MQADRLRKSRVGPPTLLVLLYRPPVCPHAAPEYIRSKDERHNAHATKDVGHPKQRDDLERVSELLIGDLPFAGIVN